MEVRKKNSFRQNMKEEWENPNSILPGAILLVFFMFVGITATIEDHVRRSFLGPNKPVKIVIHIPQPPAGGGGAVTVQPAEPWEVEAFNEWMAQAEAIVNKTKDPEAKLVFAFLKERAVLATPHPSGHAQLHEMPRRQDWIAVMPFLPRHRQTIPNWERFFYQLSADSVAGFFAGGPNTPTRLILLNGLVGLQGFTRGTTVLHEAWHAHDIMTRSSPLSNKVGSYRFQHEELWVYQDRITRIFGDPEASQWVAKEKARWGGEMQARQDCHAGQLDFFRLYGVINNDVGREWDVGYICASLAREAGRR